MDFAIDVKILFPISFINNVTDILDSYLFSCQVSFLVPTKGRTRRSVTGFIRIQEEAWSDVSKKKARPQ